MNCHYVDKRVCGITLNILNPFHFSIEYKDWRIRNNILSSINVIVPKSPNTTHSNPSEALANSSFFNGHLLYSIFNISYLFPYVLSSYQSAVILIFNHISSLLSSSSSQLIYRNHLRTDRNLNCIVFCVSD